LPTVEDQAPSASGITRDSVKLTGTVNPKQGDTRYRFEYGTTESYGISTVSQHGGDGTENDIAVNQLVADLLPDTTYHYRLVAENVAGTVEGHDYTFTTGAPTPPSAVTGGSSGVAQNSAAVGGRVNTNGLPTSYGFEIGTTTNYGPRTGLGYVGAGLSEAPVSLSLTGLVPGTTYHYRITATNVDGTSYGADETFTTSVFASTFAEPPAPLPFVSVPSIVFPGQSKSVVVKKKIKAKGKKTKKRRRVKGKKKPKNKKK
jgi:phosphodiesterase/alkaline phosphatase D-like protein